MCLFIYLFIHLFISKQMPKMADERSKYKQDEVSGDFATCVRFRAKTKCQVKCPIYVCSKQTPEYMLNFIGIKNHMLQNAWLPVDMPVDVPRCNMANLVSFCRCAYQMSQTFSEGRMTD